MIPTMFYLQAAPAHHLPWSLTSVPGLSQPAGVRVCQIQVRSGQVRSFCLVPSHHKDRGFEVQAYRAKGVHILLK